MLINYNSNLELGKDVAFLLNVSQNSQPKYIIDKFIYWIIAVVIIFGTFAFCTVFSSVLPRMMWSPLIYTEIFTYMDIIVMFLYPACIVIGYFNPERSFALNFKYHFWNMETTFSSVEDGDRLLKWYGKFTRYLSGYFTQETNLKSKVFKYRAYVKFHNMLQLLCSITLVLTCFIIGFNIAVDYNRNIHPYEFRHVQTLMWNLIYIPPFVEIIRAFLFSGEDASTFMMYECKSKEWKAKYKYHKENKHKIIGG